MIPDVTDTQNNSPSPATGGATEAAFKKGPWTTAEDSILMEYVREHGDGNWHMVQKNSGLNRSANSSRLRWANHLKPDLKKGSLSSDEETTVLELHAKFGNQWARIAAQLPGRTDNDIKNYFNTKAKRLERLGLTQYPPDIQRASAAASAPIPVFPAPVFDLPDVAHMQVLSALSSPNLLPFSSSSSLFHRCNYQPTPPILCPPPCFRSFNRSNGYSSDLQQNSNAFSSQSPCPQFTELPYFQFPAPLIAHPVENFLTQFEPPPAPMSLSNSELPLNQIIMDAHTFPPENHSGSPADDDKRIFDGFNEKDDFNPDHFFSGEEAEEEEEKTEPLSLGPDDWSEVVDANPPAEAEGEWCDGGGEISDVHSSILAGDEVLFESDIGRNQTSCIWDQLPGFP